MSDNRKLIVSYIYKHIVLNCCEINECHASLYAGRGNEKGSAES